MLIASAASKPLSDGAVPQCTVAPRAFVTRFSRFDQLRVRQSADRKEAIDLVDRFFVRSAAPFPPAEREEVLGLSATLMP